jgi:hypothetical protein
MRPANSRLRSPGTIRPDFQGYCRLCPIRAFLAISPLARVDRLTQLLQHRQEFEFAPALRHLDIWLHHHHPAARSRLNRPANNTVDDLRFPSAWLAQQSVIPLYRGSVTRFNGSSWKGNGTNRPGFAVYPLGNVRRDIASCAGFSLLGGQKTSYAAPVSRHFFLCSLASLKARPVWLHPNRFAKFPP